MFSRISMFLVLLIVIMGLIGCVHNIPMEEFKSFVLPGTEITLSLPEKGPDFHLFPTRSMFTKVYSNGNAYMALEALNRDLTVDALIVLAKVGDKVNIISVQINYCEEGFDKFNIEKKHLTEYYEDVSFMKIGKISGKLFRVNEFTNFKKIEKFFQGNEF